jgi:hypothetical protein
MESKKQRIALINTLLKYYDASNNELSNRLYQDIIHFTVGLSYEVANSCHDIAERLHIRGKKKL